MMQVFSGMDAWALYAVVGLLVFGESSGVLALLLPGELALLAGGAAVAGGVASLPGVIVAASGAALAGHAVGYELGRRYGLRMLRWRWLRRYATGVEGAARLVARRGGVAVFLGRWMNVGRVAVPLLVGAGRMPYATFTLYNVLGGVAWVVTFVLLGKVAGESLVGMNLAADLSTWLTVIVMVALGGGWLWRRLRRPVNPAKHPNRQGGEVRCTATLAKSSPVRGAA